MKINKRQIPGYELIEVIGSGGMGTVFKAQQSSLDKTVALKVLSPALALDRNYVERFVREAKSLAQLNHPNVVTVIDVGKAGDHYYLVMEYVEGETLAEIIDEQGPVSEKRALSIVRNIACALEHAQKNNLIHRDIKPDNIIVTEEGDCKLCDLGLARRAGGSSSLTAAGVAMGTPEYIAPEQARGESELDIRTDIYSLGATLYDAVVGKAPFDGATPAHIMRAHIDDPVSFPESPQLSSNLRELIEKMMAKDPALRQQDARELIEDVDRVLSGERVVKRAKKAKAIVLPRIMRSVREHFLIAGCALAAAVAAIIMLAFLIPGPSDAPQDQPERVVQEEEEEVPQPRVQRKRGRDRTAPTPPAPVRTPLGADEHSSAPPDAQLAYRAAAVFEQNPAANIEEVIRRYLAVAQKYPDTPWAEMALARTQELRDRRDRLTMEAQEEYREVEAEATSLLKEEKYHEALLALTRFALRHEGTPSGKKARRFARQLAASAARSFATACREAENLAVRGDHAGARKILSGLERTGVPGLDKMVSEKLRDLSRRESASALEEEANRRKELYEELLLELFEFGSRGDIEGALERITSARKEKKYAPIANLVGLEENDMRNALALLGVAEEGLREREGSTERFLYRGGGAVWGKIISVGNGTVTIAPEGEADRNATIKISELDDRQITNMSAYAKRPVSDVNKLLFYVARGNVEEAASTLAKIGFDFTGKQRIEKKLSLLKTIAEGRNAEALAAKVKSAYRARRMVSAALAARELFEKYAHTKYLIENAATMGQYVPLPGLLRVHSKSSSFNRPLAADIDLLPSFAIDKQLLEPRSTLRVRWEGFLSVPVDGEYTFHVMASGPVRLDLGGRKVLRESAGPELEIVSVSRKLRKGLTEFVFEITCLKGKSAIVQVFWQREDERRMTLTPADVSYMSVRHAAYQEKTK